MLLQNVEELARTSCTSSRSRVGWSAGKVLTRLGKFVEPSALELLHALVPFVVFYDKFRTGNARGEQAGRLA